MATAAEVSQPVATDAEGTGNELSYDDLVGECIHLCVEYGFPTPTPRTPTHHTPPTHTHTHHSGTPEGACPLYLGDF